MLRHQAIDKYLTDVERKSNVPKYVKPEDWVKFVDISSTSAALAAREAGKSARSKLKSPHTMGRKGQARVVAELVRFVHISSFCNYTILFWCKATLILGGFIQVLEVFFGGVGLLLDILFLS